MANYSVRTITTEGRKLLAQSLSNSASIKFTKIAVGDGQAPEAPEALTKLVHEVFNLGVAKTYLDDKHPGICNAQASFTATSDKGDFWMRELGLYAKLDGNDDSEVLYAYLNATDTADYITSVGAKSMTQIAVVISTVVGSANTLYVYDPNAQVLFKDVDEAIADMNKKLNDKLDKFTDEKLAGIEQQAQELSKQITDAAKQLETASEGFVLKGGDTMSGKLTISKGGLAVSGADNITLGTGKLIGNVTGDLTGSATQWDGWTLYDSVDELSLVATTATIPQIVAKMADRSVLHAVIPSKNANMPENIGMLEVRRVDSTIIHCLFTAFTGNSYVGAYYQNKFTGWVTTTPMPAGAMVAYGSDAAAPIGWLLCEGGTFKKTAYPALFAAIGYKWGGSGDSFKVPDTRGQFLRGWDNNRGLDSGRKFGTDQQSGVPNVTGWFGWTNALIGVQTNGAFAVKETKSTRDSNNGSTNCWAFDFNASRCSTVYQNGLKEVRVRNLAVRYIIKY